MLSSGCYDCLGSHQRSSCDQSICFDCNQVGHKNSQCLRRFRSCARCMRCGKKEHIGQECGIVLPAFHSKSLLYDPRHSLEVKCVACGEAGHINCQVAASKQYPEPSRIFRDRDHRE